MNHLFVAALIVLLPASAVAGARNYRGTFTISPRGVEVYPDDRQHHDGDRECFERGGFWRHGHCNYSHRNQRRYRHGEGTDY